MKNRFLTTFVAGVAALGLALTGCSQEASNDEGGGGDKGTIKLGYVTGWTDGQSISLLLEDQLGKMGYDVETETFADAAVLYAGVANGDVDMYPSSWPEVTHKQYMDEYGDKLEDVGAYYDNAVLTIAVPKYMDDVNSIEDLKGQADRFNGEIIGIEPGAGLTKTTKDSMLPEYGLDKEYELVTSSTAAMLTELGNATDAEEDIVVTLWRPFWANNAYPVKDLKDPKGAMGDPEKLHFTATKGFSDEFSDAADYVSKIKLDDAQYGDLEDLVVNEYEDEGEKAITEWLKKNPDAYESEITDEDE
ncbi:glycine betaine ABC transporter substrate-binding protein [Brevibacterium marinum]|uniref:Glycine betaine/proline transport system substrate-binding protein n=1 Tax=Brevibacterium marinum TaxID=418643 RepID=A0A846S2R8_9MICO|nr:glycine betaine ABC transporter substrate-binding protein [Brevibacterium marinum]NJC55852.1 glycine betaine/proline transport system substrate-binding protein [Brevibacterium marinum]